MEEPFLTAATTPVFHSRIIRDNGHPHTAQLITIETISLAIIVIDCHSSCHCHWNYAPPQNVLQPQEPEATVCMVALGVDNGDMRLVPFHLVMNVYHQ